MEIIKTAALLFVVCCLVQFTHSEVIQLTSSNIEDIFGQYELVFINFYADWCRFSGMLTPVFSEASDLVAQQYPLNSEKAVFARVDCEAERDLTKRFQITKYPTLKLVHFGEVMKKEYRGQRSPEALARYITDQLVNPIKLITSQDEMEEIWDDKRNMLAYLERADSVNYNNLLQAASHLKSDCVWHAVIGDAAASRRKDGRDVLIYRPPNSQNEDQSYTGLDVAKSLLEWATNLCIPRVRVLTFQNAEELTEEGVPFLIIFHHPDDKTTPAKFTEQVKLQLANDRDTVTAVLADGIQFAHPLSHLNKRADDLPLIAIDSFKHMYIYPHDVKTTGLEEEGLLKQFVDDLVSGKLHREFHYGPDQTTVPTTTTTTSAGQEQRKSEHLNREPSPSEDPKTPARNPTDPPESVFKKLMPSSNRYSVLDKDEL